jgi:hypothetical protein
MLGDYINSCQQPEAVLDVDAEIDLEITDGESESEYSETESDKAFIVSDDYVEFFDDPTYEPTETEAASESSHCGASNYQVMAS